LGDLDEAYETKVRAAGIRAARRWYRRQTLHSSIPLLRRRLTAPARQLPSTTSGAPMLSQVLENLRYAYRMTGRNRPTTAAVLGTMVLSLGVTTAVFSVLNGVLLRPLPFADSDRVMRMGIVNREGQFTGDVAYPDLQDYKREAHAFSDFTAAS